MNATTSIIQATMIAQTRETAAVATVVDSTGGEGKQRREEPDGDDTEYKPQPHPPLKSQRHSQVDGEEDDTGGLLELD